MRAVQNDQPHAVQNHAVENPLHDFIRHLRVGQMAPPQQHVGVVEQYNQLINSAPGGSALAGQFDLNKYVIGKTLDGLFFMLGEEEKKIRKDPAAQTTSLLKEVFGRK